LDKEIFIMDTDMDKEILSGATNSLALKDGSGTITQLLSPWPEKT
jgi:hypothetical protein